MRTSRHDAVVAKLSVALIEVIKMGKSHVSLLAASVSVPVIVRDCQ